METAARLTPDALLQHEAFVLRLARSLVHDDASARDVAQETWLTALEHPPQPGAARAWLARVTRNHALNLGRGERRRSAREARVARPEATEAGRGSQERLELQHGVVSAVLALEEPYRGVVIAVYYDGLPPSEVARRRGVAPGTVRSQLSRALDQLRERLDREHDGERGAWSLGLLALLRAKAGPAASAGGAALLPWQVFALATLAAGLVVAVAWRTIGPGGLQELPVDLAAAAGGPSRPGTEPAPAPASARVPLQAATPAQAPAGSERGGSELEDLLVRGLQIQALVLARRTEVEPDVRRSYAWLESVPDAGLVRLVDSTVFEDTLDLPWLAGGGATWSFTERTHDSRRRPQVRLEQQGLGCPSFGGAKGVVIDLGEIEFTSLALDPIATAATFDDDLRAAWEVGRRELVVEHGMDRLVLQQALRELRRDDEVEPEEGHSYLVRSFSPGEHDVLAVFQVARVGSEGCTLAWRLVESRPVEVDRPVHVPSREPDSLPEPPGELLQLDERALLAELASLRATAATTLMESLPAEVEQRFGQLRSSPGEGLARVLDAASPWIGLLADGEGACQYSFATRAHGLRAEPDVKLERGVYSMDFNVRSISWFLDLGEVDLAQAEAAAEERDEPAWALMSSATLPHLADQARRVEVQVELERHAHQVGLAQEVSGTVGHTYLVRSIFPGWHDHLVAFHIAHRDEAGDVLAWRVLRTWPVQER